LKEDEVVKTKEARRPETRQQGWLAPGPTKAATTRGAQPDPADELRDPSSDREGRQHRWVTFACRREGESYRTRWLSRLQGRRLDCSSVHPADLDTARLHRPGHAGRTRRPDPRAGKAAADEDDDSRSPISPSNSALVCGPIHLGQQVSPHYELERPGRPTLWPQPCGSR
jgi:hypothetical protein